MRRMSSGSCCLSPSRALRSSHHLIAIHRSRRTTLLTASLPLSSTPDKIRAFVALAPDPQLLHALAQIQTDLRSLPGGQFVRWTRPDQIHLTLRFLGNLTPDQSNTAIQQLQLACRGFPPFSLEIAGLGCFPGPKRPRVIWIGLRAAIPSLLALQHSVAQALSSLGDLREEGTFHPHLSLGRVREGFHRPTLDLLRNTTTPRLEPWQVRSVVFVRSQLTPAGALHSVLFTQPLQDTHPPAT
jgi:RNA 2',3'-cyclic 3'-phosphodiesterase